jgi:hypothetical protein
MSAATADPMATDDFATLLIESAAATPTPEEEPARDEARPAGEAPPTAEPDGDQPEGEQPDGDAPQDEADKPQAEQPKPGEKPQWQIDLEAAQAEREKLARENATLRGQIPNAKRQAEEAAYQRVQQEFRQNQRQELINSLQSMVNAGETTLEAANQQVAQFDAKQAAESQRAQQHAAAAERANMHLGSVALEMDHATVRLHQAGIPSLAQQAGIPEEYARQFFDADEVQRYQRAIGQAKMAQTAPGQGFNAVADADYLNTTFQGLRLAGSIYQALTARHAEAVQAKDAQIAELTKQLNRADAPDAPPEQPARGAGRRPRDADARATQILTENADALLAAFRG